jgi:hypothetical protein
MHALWEVPTVENKTQSASTFVQEHMGSNAIDNKTGAQMDSTRTGWFSRGTSVVPASDAPTTRAEAALASSLGLANASQRLCYSNCTDPCEAMHILIPISSFLQHSLHTCVQARCFLALQMRKIRARI